MGEHSLPEPRHDLTPERRAQIYRLVVILAGIIGPVAAIWGVTVDASVPAVIVAVAGSILGAGGAELARRNVSPGDGYGGIPAGSLGQ